MTPLRLLAPSLFAFAVSSCASHKADQYDTVAPSSPGQTNPAYGAAPNPVYDTPAAYEESATTPASPNPAIAPYNPEPAASTPTTPAAPTPSINGAATIHTVVAGDTLSGIAAKYKVPAASIKQANNMTKDTVILGRKMVIPPVR